METDKDHIHFLISYDTTDSICEIVKRIKQETTYRLWRKHSFGKEKHFGQMVILPVVSVKYHLQQFKDILKLKARKEHGTPPTT
jgi:putative transposase